MLRMPLRELDCRNKIEARIITTSRESSARPFSIQGGTISRTRARAKNVGWEQTLWEKPVSRARATSTTSGRCKISRKQLKAVCSLVARRKISGGENIIEFQARLLGVSGLLPDELTRAEKNSDSYLRRVWDLWWRERDGFSENILPRAVWKFHGLRPANHPQRRLALAAHWLADKNFISKIENWSAAELPDKKLLDLLLEIFQVERDEFWSWHWTFKSARMKKPQPLLGDARVTDLAVNVVLPWLWVRAKEGGNKKNQNEIERRFFAWPAAEDNSVLKLARQRLLRNFKREDFQNGGGAAGLDADCLRFLRTLECGLR